MNWIRKLGILGITMLVVALLPESAVTQQKSLKEQLLGTWILVSYEATRPDGSKALMFGANPKGIALFDAGGQYVISVMRSDRAKYANNDVAQFFAQGGTAEENKAAAQGTMTYFGTYSVSEADGTIAIHIEASSFPNWNGADQKRIFAITGDQLTLTVRGPTGGRADVVWRRGK